MGTTMACAQCHDHKYAPLSQKEYFQLYAILNNTADADRRDESPVVHIPWERLFGIGIVSTSEEFGSQGDLPSHPELLDWLATELVARQWDVKQILRLMVTSAAYRQTSKCPPDLVARDRENRLVDCGPRVRRPAEVIRDQALAASCLLSRKKGGPSVNPPQPNLGLSAAFGGRIDWQTSAGEDRYRRAIYTTWRRSNPYPSMATFDAPSREVRAIRRPTVRPAASGSSSAGGPPRGRWWRT